jgi:hypothetical protein
MFPEEDQVSVIDLAMALYRFRLVVIACTIIGAGYSLYAFSSRPDPVAVADITLDVYPGGIPPFVPSEVGSQLLTVVDGDYVQRLNEDDTPLVVRVPENKAGDIEKGVADYVQTQDSRIAQTLSYISRSSPEVDAYLDLRTYSDGRREGFIEPVRVSIVRHMLSQWSAMRALLPAIIGLCGGIVLSLAASAFYAWRRYFKTHNATPNQRLE